MFFQTKISKAVCRIFKNTKFFPTRAWGPHWGILSRDPASADWAQGVPHRNDRSLLMTSGFHERQSVWQNPDQERTNHNAQVFFKTIAYRGWQKFEFVSTYGYLSIIAPPIPLGILALFKSTRTKKSTKNGCEKKFRLHQWRTLTSLMFSRAFLVGGE